MIDILLDLLGYSGNDPVITYLVVGFSLLLACCFVYRIVDLISTLIYKIK